MTKESQLLAILADYISLRKLLLKICESKMAGRAKKSFPKKDLLLRKLFRYQPQPAKPASGFRKVTYLQNDMCHASLNIFEDVPKMIVLSEKHEAFLYSQFQVTPAGLRSLVMDILVLMMKIEKIV